MYCPSCGLELTTELSYCNRCGANLRTSAQAGVPAARLTGAAWAISTAVALITLGGFAMVFGLVMALITRGIRLNEGGMVLIFFTLFTILAIAWMLIKQLSRVLDIPQLAGAATPPTAQKLGHQPTPQIAAPPEPVSSVTDHTTRTFEPVRRGERPTD